MKGNERGISLVALIITIIVLLILAGTAIATALSGESLFSKSSEAKSTWNAAVAEEYNSLNDVVDVLINTNI